MRRFFQFVFYAYVIATWLNLWSIYYDRHHQVRTKPPHHQYRDETVEESEEFQKVEAAERREAFAKLLRGSGDKFVAGHL